MSTPKSRSRKPSTKTVEPAEPAGAPSGDVGKLVETLNQMIRAGAVPPAGKLAKTTIPHAVLQNTAWKAKYAGESEDDEVELVDFPAWAFWFEKRKGDKSLCPVGEPIVPSDDEGNFEFGSELTGYMGFSEPEDIGMDLLDTGDDDSDEDDEDSDDDIDDDDDDDDEDDGGEDGKSVVGEREVIDTEGQVIEEGEPAGRMGRG